MYPDKGSARVYEAFRRAVTKYTLGLFPYLDAEALYAYSETGDSGKANTRAYLNYIKTGNWGKSSIPLYQQISGALKVIGRFQFHLGIKLPYMDRLADSCIMHHADGGFYTDADDMCFPRNVAEMCVTCLESSDYRREDLLKTLFSIAEFIHQYKMPDGAFASDRKETLPKQWCGAHLCGQYEKPRSNINGTQGAIWPDMPFENPQAGWREKIAKLKYRIILAPDGKVEIVKK